MKTQKAVKITKTSNDNLNNLINIPPQLTIPKMPQVQAPKRT